MACPRTPVCSPVTAPGFCSGVMLLPSRNKILNFMKLNPKPPPREGAKSNPSKRHRDRLNGELDKLTSLLPFPEDVRARLDKLSVLRLSVGYLKAKSFFSGESTMKNGSVGWPVDKPSSSGSNGMNVPTTSSISFSEGDLLLQALNGFVLVVTSEGSVFYASPTIQDYLGFLQSDVIHQSVFELIHTDDRATFKSQLHFALNPTQFGEEGDGEGVVITYDPHHIPPENSSFLERSFVCRFRCLLDNSSGFLALNFQGRLKYLHGQNKVAEDGTIAHPQLALFTIATPLQPPSIMDIRIKTLIFQTKHKLDFTPIGIDTRGKVVLGYNEIELTMRGSGYQFIHAADMMHCADNHIRMIKTGESGLTVFRLLTKTEGWVWVQANARLVFKGGRPDFIVASQRALTNKEGEEHFRQRKMQLPFNLSTGEAVLYETGPTLDIPDINAETTKIQNMADAQGVDPNSLLGLMLKQDQSAYLPQPDPQISMDQIFMDSHAVLNVPSNHCHFGTPRLDSRVKKEVPAKAMKETLEQILEDYDALRDLEVDAEELEEWESALLKMNISNSDEPVELDSILTDDILSYVEDAFFMGKADSQYSTEQSHSNAFVETPHCLQGLELQDTVLSDNAPIINQNDLMSVNSQNLVGTESSGLSLEDLLLYGLNNLTQQTQPERVFTKVWDAPKVTFQNGFSGNDFGSCDHIQNYGLPSPEAGFSLTTQNGLEPYSQGPLQPARKVYLNGTIQSFHDHMQPTMMDHPIVFQQQNSTDVSTPVSSNQEREWGPSILNTNFTGSLTEVCTDNVSPSAAISFQRHFPPQTQTSQTQRLQTWQHQKQLPPAMQNGHQSLSNCYGQNATFRGSAHRGLSSPNTQACVTGCRLTPSLSTMSSTPYCSQLGQADPTPQASKSCMFEGSSLPPVNGTRFSHTGLLSSQKVALQHGQTIVPTSCLFQSSKDGPRVDAVRVVQDDAIITGLSCKMTTGFNPETLQAQQQYLSQTEVIMPPIYSFVQRKDI
uniref:Aryl hydrocarbon receptor n=1 Tax=Paramormyrops kingsleyae TaxID=1676925 RepID=A0A3B3T6T7_9TELE